MRTATRIALCLTATMAIAFFVALANAEERRANAVPAPVDPTSATAVSPSAAAPVPRHGSGRGAGYRVQHSPRTVDEQVDALAKRVTLTDRQKIQLRQILQQKRDAFAQISADTSISGADRITRLRALQLKSVEQVKSVLTEEQQKHLGLGSNPTGTASAK